MSWQRGGNEGKRKKYCDNETMRNNFWDSRELKLLLNVSASGSWPHLKPTGMNQSRKCPWQENINDWLHLLKVYSSFLLSRLMLSSLLFFCITISTSVWVSLSTLQPPATLLLHLLYCIGEAHPPFPALCQRTTMGELKTLEEKSAWLQLWYQDEFSATLSRQKQSFWTITY